ncbi:MAG: uroporphyrinogen-III synthase [Proteobacteria bacterium]|nr:uroporphyrinogen-III synthase [Pseudomonadota bacterium]
MLLNKLKVLVTRPVHQADSLCKLIEYQGGQAIRLPVIQIIDCNNNWQAYNFDSFDIAIFISSNAVEKTLSNIVLPTKLQLFAVGKSTAATLQKLGLTALCPAPPFNSETLLLMPQLQTIINKQIVIFRGKEGRELLAESLRKRKAKVQYISVYQRLKPPNPTQNIYADITIITSGEGLKNLLAMLPKSAWIQQNPMVVISERLAQKAKQLGIQAPILVAPTASNDGLLIAVLQAANIV